MITDILEIEEGIAVAMAEIDMIAVRSQGAGGQNVNKVSTAIHLRFDILGSSLPDEIKERLMQLKDRRISRDGVVVIKAQRSRSQDNNKADALERLADLIRKGLYVQPERKPSKPGRAARQRRMDEKTRRGQLKSLRGKVES